MPTTSVDIPDVLYRYVESEGEEGRYQSKAEGSTEDSETVGVRCGPKI